MAALELLDKVAEFTGIESQRPEIVGHEMATPKYWADHDVAVLTNVWNWKRFVGKVSYPIFSKPAPQAAAGPRILFVGGSFIFQVSDTVAEQRLCSKIDILFYDNKWIHYQGATRGRKQSIDKSRRNLAALLSGYDAVVIESNETLLSQLGYGFIEDACRAVGLEVQPKPGR